MHLDVDGDEEREERVADMWWREFNAKLVQCVCRTACEVG